MTVFQDTFFKESFIQFAELTGARDFSQILEHFGILHFGAWCNTPLMLPRMDTDSSSTWGGSSAGRYQGRLCSPRGSYFCDIDAKCWAIASTASLASKFSRHSTLTCSESDRLTAPISWPCYIILLGQFPSNQLQIDVKCLHSFPSVELLNLWRHPSFIQ